MRLISAHVRGFGRIIDSKINLDAKVIAIVGPNEAGKTTVLRALSHVDDQNPVPLPQRSRATEVSDDTRTIQFDYVLDQSDHDALVDLDLNELPTRAKIARNASADRLTVDLMPRPVKSVAAIENVLDDLKAAQSADDLDEWIDPDTTYADPNSDAARDFRAELQSVVDAVEASIAEPGIMLTEEIDETAQSLLGATTAKVDAEFLRHALQTVVDWSQGDDPAGAARDRIWKRSPDFIMFDEAHRSIQSSYTFDEQLVANPPVALANLAGTASLDLPTLLAFVRSGDVARRRTAVVQANSRMDAIFANAWKQSSLSVHFEIDGDQLRIELMEDGGNVTIFDERSAGLRMFVALISFLKVHGSVRPPILLIDEAENHLHIDAQADLVTMFVTQQHAVKVIYTTHSPACLPPDLGTGIRTVVPRPDNVQVSDVRNNFWQGAAGYSSLMLAMGAGAAAFTPARSVVLAEGATEMILLPTLLRSATGETELPYQVAPGLSEVPNAFLPQLDLEASRVAYLVDGDAGGARLRTSLLEAGVPERLIIDLELPGIESLLESKAYLDALSALLPECNPENSRSAIPALPFVDQQDAESRAAFKTWFETQNLRAPSKVAVANWLVENQRAVPSSKGAAVLKELHARLVAALSPGK